jgi:hypothetical protein
MEVAEDKIGILLTQYRHLMTQIEVLAYARHSSRLYQPDTSSKESFKKTTEQFGFDNGELDRQVHELTNLREADLYQRIAKRLLTEYNDDTIKRCAKCKSLLRTPDANQCPKCFYRWS